MMNGGRRATPRQAAKSLIAVLRRYAGLPLAAAWGRLMALGPRPPGMAGAFPDRSAALASLASGRLNSYDNAEVAQINFQLMCETRVWDYPVMFWLEKLRGPGFRVLDAGGHFGTKYIAFGGRVPVGELQWTVYDLPATIETARAAQKRGKVPAAVSFLHDLAAAGPVDLFLASGLLQYLDVSFTELLARLPDKPRHVILNKVAVRDGPAITTLEKIGPARVPYQIRSRQAFEAELASLGFAIRDCWEIPSLSHVIGTHPALGASTSLGYYLERPDNPLPEIQSPGGPL